MNLRPSGYEPDELPSCSIPRQIERSHFEPKFKVDGVEGFEPPNDWTKTSCLTAWRYPNRISLSAYVDGIIAPNELHVKGFLEKNLKF